MLQDDEREQAFTLFTIRHHPVHPGASGSEDSRGRYRQVFQANQHAR